MKTARNRPGRPRVVDRPQFLSAWAQVYPRIVNGELSHGAAARELNIGFATLLRLLRAAEQGNDDRGRPA